MPKKTEKTVCLSIGKLPEFCFVLLLWICLFSAACGDEMSSTSYEAEYLFIDHLDSIVPVQGDSVKPKVSRLEIGFDQRYTLFANPPAAYRFKAVPSGPQARLLAAPAMDPRAWSEPTDGVAFEVLCRRPDGSWATLLDLTVSPTSNPQSRIWHDREMPLDQCSQPTTEIELRTSCGVEKNCDADWAVWGDPHVVYRKDFSPKVPRLALLISIDTLRPDRLGVYGAERPTSPHLDRLAEDGIVFETTIASAPWTIPSHATMLTSTYPRFHGATAKSAISEDARLISEVLREAGWQTAGFVDTFFLHEPFGFHRGFDHFDSDPPPGGAKRKGSRVNRQRIIDWLDEAYVRPTFVFWHIMDVHGSYGAPAPFGGRFRKSASSDSADSRLEKLKRFRYHEYLELDRFSSFPELLAAYDEGIAKTDDIIGGLLELLKGAGLYDDALIVVTSDHGESFLDHDVWVGHGLFLFEDELRVPLIVKLPGNKYSGIRVQEMVRSLDIAPTILDALGISPAPAFQGLSLISPEPGSEASLPEIVYGYSSNTEAGFVRTRNVKFIGRSSTEMVLRALKPVDGVPVPARVWDSDQIYDLRRDPGEKVPLSGSAAEEAMERFRGLLAEHVTRSVQKKVIYEESEDASSKLSSDALERLRALGYVVGDSNKERIAVRPEEMGRSDGPYVFLDHLNEATIVSPGSKHVMSTSFAVSGEVRFVLFEHPDSEVTFHGLAIDSGSSLEFGIGMDEESWDCGGDGVQFEVTVREKEGVERTVYSRYLDPKNRPEDRKWFDEVVDLERFAGKRLSIKLRTSGGPEDSKQCDWAGWSTPQLRHRVERRTISR